MPKRSEARDKAFEIWKASRGKMPLVGIAELLGVPAVKVRKWKQEDEWEATVKKPSVKRTSKKSPKTRSPTKKKTAEKTGKNFLPILGNKNKSEPENEPKEKISGDTKNQTSKSTQAEIPKKTSKRGAQKGNKLAVGHGAPKGNTNAVKTGEYQTVRLSTMTKEEWAVYNAAQIDPMTAIDEEIRVQAVRRFRMDKLYRKMERRKADRYSMDIYEFEDKDTMVSVTDENGEEQEAIVKQRQEQQVRRIDHKRTMDDKMLAAINAAVRVDRQRLTTLVEKAKLEQGQKALALKERKFDAEDW